MKRLVLCGLLFCVLSLCMAVESVASEWKRVYLATYPKSGNHWMRFLIEEVTGVATGSVYCDQNQPAHMPAPFAWGGYSTPHGYTGKRRYPTKRDIVVIKTHFPVIDQ